MWKLKEFNGGWLTVFEGVELSTHDVLPRVEEDTVSAWWFVNWNLAEVAGKVSYTFQMHS